MWGTEPEDEVQTGGLSLTPSMTLSFEHLPLPMNGFLIKWIYEEWRTEAGGM